MAFRRVQEARLPPTRASLTSRNLALRASVGLRQLSIRIASEHRREAVKKDTEELDVRTDTNGRLLLDLQHSEDVLLAYRFKVVGWLGEGAFAQTVKALDTYDPACRLVAVKVMHAHCTPIGDEECLRLRSLPESPHHIVRLITSFHHGPHACLVFELLQPKPLLQLLPSPSDDRRLLQSMKLNAIRKLSCQLLTALMLLRQKNIIHADIKPDNILFRNGTSLILRKSFDVIRCIASPEID